MNPLDLREAGNKPRRGKTLIERAGHLIGADKSKAVPKNTSGQLKRLLSARLAAKHAR